MNSPSIELMLIAGRAAFLLIAFTVAAVAFVRWRRAAARDTERVISQLTALSEKIDAFDERLAFLDARLTEISQQIDTPVYSPTPTSGASPSYPIAIRLARNGATCEQIMESCGIGRQEAELVRRLHGPGKRSSRSQHAAA